MSGIDPATIVVRDFLPGDVDEMVGVLARGMHHRRVRCHLGDLTRGLDPVAGNVRVQQHDVGVVLTHRLHRAGRVARFAAHCDPGIPSKCGDFHYEEMSWQRYDGSTTRSSGRARFGS